MEPSKRCAWSHARSAQTRRLHPTDGYEFSAHDAGKSSGSFRCSPDSLHCGRYIHCAHRGSREIDMAFQNRAQAGQMLARRLEMYRGQHPLVLAIPRGAVPMAKIVADALDGELDVVLVRKLRAPHNPELAIGSIDDTGSVYVDPDTRDLYGTSRISRRKRRPSWTRCGDGASSTNLQRRRSTRLVVSSLCWMTASRPDPR